MYVYTDNTQPCVEGKKWVLTKSDFFPKNLISTKCNKIHSPGLKICLTGPTFH